MPICIGAGDVLHLYEFLINRGIPLDAFFGGGQPQQQVQSVQPQAQPIAGADNQNVQLQPPAIMIPDQQQVAQTNQPLMASDQQQQQQMLSTNQ